MQLFYCKDITPNAFCTLDVEESRHAVRVLRLREGDELNVTDGLETFTPVMWSPPTTVPALWKRIRKISQFPVPHIQFTSLSLPPRILPVWNGWWRRPWR